MCRILDLGTVFLNPDLPIEISSDTIAFDD
jgi:hypothetical protein